MEGLTAAPYQFKIFKNGSFSFGDYGATAVNLANDDISFSMPSDNSSVTLLWDAAPAIATNSLYGLYIRSGFRDARVPSFTCGK